MGISYNSSVVKNGLIMHLDAANIKSYPGTGTTWKDLSGNGNHATLINGVGFNSNNKGTLVTDAIDDYIVYPATNDTCLSTPYFTVDCWCSVDSLFNGGNDEIIYAVDKNYYGYQQPTIACYISSRYNRFGVKMTTALGAGEYNVYVTIPNNSWLNVSYVLNNTTLSLYLNGKNRLDQNINLDYFPYITPSVTRIHSLGLWQTGNTLDWASSNFSCLKIYNRALTDVEIKQNFESTRGRYGI